MKAFASVVKSQHFHIILKTRYDPQCDTVLILALNGEREKDTFTFALVSLEGRI